MKSYTVAHSTRLIAGFVAFVLMSAVHAEEKLIFVGTGGSYGQGLQVAYLQPFSQETGIKVEIVESGGEPIAQLKAQMAAGNVLWDIVLCAPTYTLSFPELFEPIDRSIVTADPGIPGAIGERRVLMDLEAFPVIGYRTDKFPDPPKGWADFYNVEDFPGPRGVFQYGLDSGWVLPATALLAQGVAPEDLIPLDLDRGYKLLNEFKPNIRAYYTGFSQAQDMLRSGEIVMGLMTDGRVLQMIRAGAPMDLVWNQAFLYRASVCPVKGSPNSKNAMKFFQWVLSHPQNQVVFSSITMYGPPTVAGGELLKETTIKDFTTLHVDELIPDSDELLGYIKANSDELLDRWNAYIQE